MASPPVSIVKSWYPPRNLHAPHFDDTQAPALRAVVQRELLQRYDAVRNAV